MVITPHPGIRDWDEDEPLVLRARSGDGDARDMLVIQYQRLVIAVISEVVQEPHQAEDLCQEAFLTAFTHLDDLVDGRRFAAWLKTIALRQCWAWVERQRQEDRRHRHLARQADPDPLARDHDDDHVDAWIAIADSAVARLSDPQCEMLFLFYVRGLSTDRIAAFAGCPAGTVKRRLFDARQDLQEAMPDGPPPAGDPAAHRILTAVRRALSLRVNL